MRQSGSDPRSLQREWLNLDHLRYRIRTRTPWQGLAGAARQRLASALLSAPLGFRQLVVATAFRAGCGWVPEGDFEREAAVARRGSRTFARTSQTTRHVLASPSVRLNNRAFGGRQGAMDGARSATDVFRTRDTVHNSTISCTALPGHRANDGARAPFPSHLERLCREARLHEQRLELGLVLEEAHRPGRRLLPRR